MEGASKFERKKTVNCIFNFLIYYIIPLDRTNPPSAKSVSSAHEPKVLATTMLLPIAAINRNNAEAI